MDVLPTCCPACGNDTYNKTGKLMGRSQLPARQCRACTFWYDEKEGQAAFHRRKDANH